MDSKGVDTNENTLIHSGSKTLDRLNDLLNAITGLHLDFNVARPEKQTIKIELVRQFFINSVVLLNKDDVEKLSKKILVLQPIFKTGIKSGSHARRQIFDPQLDLKLDKILIQLQVLLKSHLMPDTNKEGRKKTW